MKNVKMYESSDKMITLIKDNYSVLQALGAFGINLGFGDMTVSETCQLNGVDTYTFLAVVNFTINDHADFENDEQISVPTLLHYLKVSHTYYLDFQLPFIRRELQESRGEDPLPLCAVIARWTSPEQLQHPHLLQASRTDGQEVARTETHDYQVSAG